MVRSVLISKDREIEELKSQLALITKQQASLEEFIQKSEKHMFEDEKDYLKRIKRDNEIKEAISSSEDDDDNIRNF